MKKQSLHLAQETRITWIENPNQFPYLREATELFPFRSRFPIQRYLRNQHKRLVGYSEISAAADAIHHGFYRRVWFLNLPNDPYSSGSPWEGVKPSSIKPRDESAHGREDKVSIPERTRAVE